jgi:hypothetical protein
MLIGGQKVERTCSVHIYFVFVKSIHWVFIENNMLRVVSAGSFEKIGCLLDIASSIDWLQFQT